MEAEGSSTATPEQNDGAWRYMIVRPERGGIASLVSFAVRNDVTSRANFLECSDDGASVGETSDHRWVIVVSIVVRKIIALIGKPMEWMGCLVDFVLNLLSENGNFFGLLWNLVKGKVVVPERGTETFISTIGHLDGRIDLYKGESLVDDIRNGVFTEMENQALKDLYIMASKLAYENSKVVKNVVTHHWKMHFVDFYDCWNDFQKQRSTQVFILTDKPKDANLILISFRGTEPFDADDWITDFDYSWYDIPKLGKVHMGFLEALGLGNRINTATFQNNIISLKKTEELVEEEERELRPAMAKLSAYFAVRAKLKSLLEEHRNAKFSVTGHSLGGALAVLFPTVLVLHEEEELLGKLLSVYTFGQPRVGNRKLGRYMEARLNNGIVPRYYRVVYCNDLVPRLPYDDKTFLYKHFGVCLYYNSLYVEQRTKEEPNKNYFGPLTLVGLHLNAIWELIRCFLIGYVYGRDYEEGWFSMLARFFGLFLPGISAHCPTDYVNSVRLGRDSSVHMSSF